MTDQIIGHIDTTEEHPEDNWSALVPDHDRGRLFHDECGYLWRLHDNSTPLNKLPFGCPSELWIRHTWGDR